MSNEKDIPDLQELNAKLREFKDLKSEISALRTELAELKSALSTLSCRNTAELRDLIIFIKDNLRNHVDSRYSAFLNTFYDFRQMRYHENNPDMRLYHSISGKLLHEFKKICDKYGLDYWLDGGTLLGAMRHQDFIPWDDDLDVGTTRKDIDKILKAVKKSGRLTFKYYFKFDGGYFFKLYFKNLETRPWLDVFVYADTDIDNIEEMTAFIEERRKKLVEEIVPIQTEKHLPSPCLIHCDDYQNIEALDRIFRKFLDIDSDPASVRSLTNITLTNSELKVLFHRYESIFPLGRAIFNGYEYKVPHIPDEFLRTLYNNYHLFSGTTGKITHTMNLTYDQVQAMLEFERNYVEPKDEDI